MPTEIKAHLHVYAMGSDWFVGETPEACRVAWADYYGDEWSSDSDPDPVLVPDEEDFEISEDGGDTAETKPARQWASERGPGWLCHEL